jgi:hypothetical protein
MPRERNEDAGHRRLRPGPPPKPLTKVNARLAPPLNNPRSKAVLHHAATADYTPCSRPSHRPRSTHACPALDPSHGKAVQHDDP